MLSVSVMSPPIGHLNAIQLNVCPNKHPLLQLQEQKTKAAKVHNDVAVYFGVCTYSAPDFPKNILKIYSN